MEKVLETRVFKWDFSIKSLLLELRELPQKRKRKEYEK